MKLKWIVGSLILASLALGYTLRSGSEAPAESPTVLSNSAKQAPLKKGAPSLSTAAPLAGSITESAETVSSLTDQAMALEQEVAKLGERIQQLREAVALINDVEAQYDEGRFTDEEYAYERLRAQTSLQETVDQLAQ